MARRVWAIADLHLGGGVGKTMDRFGAHWQNHAERIADNARRVVGPEDIFLLPGDLSWATKPSQAAPDLEYMAALPGIKVAIKGNHDYWWDSDKPLLYPGLISPPQTFDDGRIGIAGSRGWFTPNSLLPTYKRDVAAMERERKRLQKSLLEIENCPVKIAMIHYPPHPFVDQLKDAGVTHCVYGHLHVDGLPEDEPFALYDVDLNGVRVYCVSCDRVDYTPQLIGEF